METNSVSLSFYNKIVAKWQDVRNSSSINKLMVPEELIGSAYRLPFNSISKLWAFMPEILNGWIESNFDQKRWLQFYPSENFKSLDGSRGILVCHTLNPTWESAAIIAELGRASRLSAGMGKPLRLMLAGTTWAKHNWVVQDLDLEVNLSKNLEWRRRLYGNLSLEYDKCEINDIEYDGKNVDVENLAKDYAYLARAIWGDEIVSARIDDVKIEELLQKLTLCVQGDNKFNLLDIPLISDSLAPHIEVVTSVLENLKRLDVDTFTYFLLQYFHQAKYANYIKLAPMRERGFDEPFRSMDKSYAVERGHNTQSYIYMSDYYFCREGLNMESLTVHPYYFPSGVLYSKYPNPYEARDRCLMLGDGLEKIKTSLLSQKRLDRARFIADLMSFAHFSKGRAKKRVADWCMKMGGDINKSWKTYSVDSQTFSRMGYHWSRTCFTEIGKENTIPYYYLPYNWEYIGVSLEDESKLVMAVLNSVIEDIPVPSMFRQPMHSG